MMGFGKVRRRVRAWGRRHSYSFFSSLGTLLQHRLGTLMTVLVLGIAIVLPLGLYVMLKNLDRLDLRQEEWNAISAFLPNATPEQDVAALADELRARIDTAEVSVISPEEGMAEFREASGFGTSLGALDENPLPWVMTVIPAVPEGGSSTAALELQVQSLTAFLEANDLVESVQFDYKWLQRLGRLLELGRAAVLVLTLLFGLSVIVLVANTIRLDVAARAQEIEVLALVGAGNAFIRQPFLYSGFWYGVMGGILAFGLMWLALLYLSQPLERLLNTYGHGFRLYSLGGLQAAMLFLCSGMLGWLGALVSVQRYLKMLAVGGTLGRR
jgi:cell division transport system permease protein